MANNEDLKKKALEAYDKTLEQLAEDITRECANRRNEGGYYCYCVEHYSIEDLALMIIKNFEPVFDENNNWKSVPNGRFTGRIFDGDHYHEIYCESIQDAAYCLRLFLRVKQL